MRNNQQSNAQKTSFNKKLMISDRFSDRFKEGAFILSIILSLLLFIGLVTYQHTDASGKLGNIFSQSFFYLFGYTAFILPFVFPYIVGKSIFKKSLPQHSNNFLENNTENILWQIVGFFVMIIAICGLASLEFPDFYRNIFNHTGGGILGEAISTGLVAAFSPLGATILLFGCLLCGITLFTGLSWIDLSLFLGEKTLNFISRLVAWHNIKNEQRLLKRYQSQQQTEKTGFLKAIKNIKNTQNTQNINNINNNARDNDPTLTEENLLSASNPSRQEPVLTPFSQASEKLAPVSCARSDAHSHANSNLNSDLNSDSQSQSSLDSLSVSASPSVKKSAAIHKNNAPIHSHLPVLSLLDLPEISREKNYSPQALELMSREVEEKLKDFNIIVQVVAAHPGPVVTRYEMQLAPGIKASRITSLARDLARSLAMMSVRVVEIIPGKSFVGLELPNQHREIVRLSEVLSAPAYQDARSPVSLALGKDIAGHPVVVDLAKMPHLLVAGTTGSGKSVGLNAMLLSFLFKASPQEMRMIMIDPKMLELSIYEGIPHLLTPVVTDMKQAANALRWCVAEMERRYRLMSALGVRNLAGFNAKIQEAEKKGAPLLDPFWRAGMPGASEEPSLLTHLPYIVVIIDEFADMIMVVGKKVEELIARIAQKARAAGIHLILATQRPSVDVITGLIKANIPTRIAFQVSSKIDSRTILDQQGAEQLLGHGDMLYLAPGTGVPVRVHGAFVADHEVHSVVESLKKQGAPDYIDGVLDDQTNAMGAYGDEMSGSGENANNNGESDELYDEAVKIVLETRKASISSVQRRLSIGYNRAARLLEAMETARLVSPMDQGGKREILAPDRIE